VVFVFIYSRVVVRIICSAADDRTDVDGEPEPETESEPESRTATAENTFIVVTVDDPQLESALIGALENGVFLSSLELIRLHSSLGKSCACSAMFIVTAGSVIIDTGQNSAVRWLVNSYCVGRFMFQRVLM